MAGYMSMVSTFRKPLVAILAIVATFGAFSPCFATDGSSATDSGTDSPAAMPTPADALLDTGFHDLYTLDFQGARKEFITYQNVKPEDPLGKAAEAASYLYEEFNEKGVFTSAFFLNDSKLLVGVEGDPAQNRNEGFLDANRAAHEMAKQRVASDPNDERGLLVLTITDGMESDYRGLIERKQIASLGLMRQAEGEANKLLMIDPTAQDAYVALGASSYIIGCLPGYKRIFLRIGGIKGDKERGMQEMQIAAEHGRYLSPFAKILLALAYEREHQVLRAQVLLTDLTQQFPENPLFAQELFIAEHNLPAKR